jgi:hypothetical protein
MAIPHNTNLSNGDAFPSQQVDGSPIDENYIRIRSKNEPLVEVHQAKGNSEVSAQFWQNDEYANFENYEVGSDPNNFVRHVLKRGIQYEEELGANPFKLGMIGSTDTHNGTPGNTEEYDEFIGNHLLVDELAERRASREWVLDPEMKVYEAVNPGGLAAIWAESNTRPDLYDAMMRKETYATSGTRIQLRFFAGYNYEISDTDYEALTNQGYSKGVAMGGDLEFRENDIPSFLIWAAKDPLSANLDKIQVIKGWYENEELKEKIFDAVVSDQYVQNDLKAVNLETGEWDRTKGSPILSSVWQDPEFNKNLSCFYYLRVLEVPTPRWNLWDEINEGVKYPDSVPKVIRERAWSSPIWYTAPKN